MLRTLNWLALVLVIVGGLNWGLIGFFDYNLVAAIFGAIPWLERTVYAVVGLAAVYMVYYAAVVEGHVQTTRHRTLTH